MKNDLQLLLLFVAHGVCTDLQPKKCYQCAVTALRSSGPVMGSIEGISTQQSGWRPMCMTYCKEAFPDLWILHFTIITITMFLFTVPEQGPELHTILKESESLKVKLSKIPQSKIRGCLRKYSIYLQDDSKNIKHYSK